ncbi:MAG: hypothetical protein IT435_03605 [Phycisphaerales bacterium]|nr:hypothetical protein [Phycisphaerales bacterium]
MGCIIFAIGFFLPRTAIVLLVLFSDYIGRAWQNDIWPFLGFCFMPYTTLAYAWGINSTGKIEGLQLAAVIFAALLDLGVIGGGKKLKDSGRRNVRIRA